MVFRNENTLIEQLYLGSIKLFVLLTAFAVFTKKASLYLNYWELKKQLLKFKSTTLAEALSLLNSHKLPNVIE